MKNPARIRKPTEKSKAKTEKATVKVKKPKGRGSKSKGVSILDMPLDSDDEVEVVDEGAGAAEVDWKDEDLNWAMLTAVTDSPEIKQGLFPSPGQDTRQGKGKRKTDHQFAIATIIFSQNPKYQAAFALAKTAAEKAVWTRKIKNRLDTMVRACRQYTTEMGETGAGITREEQIDMGLTNEFTTKWAIIKEAFPWYFTMKELISERPNVVPVGLGNSATGFDIDILQSTAASHDPDDPSVHSSITPATDLDDADMVSDEEPTSTSPSLPPTETVKSESNPKKRTLPKTSNSAPAPAPQPSKKSKGTHEKLAEIAAKEEETTQKLLDLKMQKLQGSNAISLANIEGKNQVRLQREKLQAEIFLRKQEQEFQLRLASLKASGSNRPNSPYWPTPNSFHGYNSASSSTHVPSSPLSSMLHLLNDAEPGDPFMASGSNSNINFPSTD